MAMASAEDKYNRKNPSVKRILQEIKEMQSNPSDDFLSLPLEEDIFDWQFAILGPRDSEFEGGIYHGRIQLPADYPLKPPAFMMLTPNGRFETQTKICLSISNHHPEHWQPSWGVRTALVALIAFMPTNPEGALGSLDFKKEDRRKLAIRSREAAPRYGTPERQKLIDEIHQHMLSKAPPVPQLPSSEEQVINPVNEAAAIDAADPEVVLPAEELPDPEPEQQRFIQNVREIRVHAVAGRVRLSISAGVRLSRRVPAALPREQAQRRNALFRMPFVDDRLFTCAAIGLMVAIIILLVKKFLKSHGLAI